MNVSSIYSLDNIQTETKTTSTQVNNEGNSFSSYLSCTKSLEDIFQEAAATYDVPVNLLKAVAKAESNFDPNAVSCCGAQGIMQLMPATASYLGVEDAFDPEQNIMGGAKYLSNLLKTYDGDITLTLAAYNAGSGNVKKYGGVPPFKETQNYIKKISGYLNQDFSLDTIIYSSKNNTTSSAVSNSQNTVSKKNVTSLVSNTSSKDSSSYSSTGLLGSVSSTRNLISDLSFNYEDYMRFLEAYSGLSLLEEEEEETSTTYNTAKEILSSSSKWNFFNDNTQTTTI
ncbi:MAG: lytic transglycosylase domain-containing protein [Lachnospiraceae bacterium]|nr:lytic transglycosylase domain-containing protein [Lachnospiraceae bacterium]